MKQEPPLVLVVDDNPTNLSVLFEYLEESGFEVAVAQSGENAINQLQHVRPDLILLDVLMPGIDGFETCRQLKTNEKTKDIPVIFMTALTDEIDKVKGFLAGGTDYITKPFQHEEMLARLNAHLGIRKLQQSIRVQNELLEEQQVLIKQKDEQLKKLYGLHHPLSSSVPYDLQTPLNSLLESVRLLDKNMEQYDKKEMKNRIRNLRNSAETLYTVHENSLMWFNIQRNSAEFTPQLIHIEKIAADTIAFFTSQAQQKWITLSSSLQENTLAYADYKMIDAVIRNLISNALKFTPDGGKISLSARPADSYIVVSVSNTGIGIKKEELESLFQLDEPCQDTAGAGEERTGSDLLLCKKLIEKNGGKIWAESESEKNSIFRFTLPQKSEK